MQPALERQLAKAEGEAREARAARAERENKKKKGAGKGARGATSKKASRDSAHAAAPAIVDVDTADSLALARLPGVGPSLARRIVLERQRLGAFGGLEALDAVPGVGPKLLAALAPRVTFSGPRRPILGQGQPDGGRGRSSSRQAGRRRRVER
jgi:DNA uptake protein ComE-like DNA-binding protein